MLSKEKSEGVQVKLYTANEALDRINEIHSEMVAMTAEKDDSGKEAIIEMLVGMKLIAMVKEKIDKGEF